MGEHAPRRRQGLGRRRARVHAGRRRVLLGPAPVRASGGAAQLAHALRDAARVAGAKPVGRVQGHAQASARRNQGGGASAPRGRARRQRRHARRVRSLAAATGAARAAAAELAAQRNDRGHAQLPGGRRGARAAGLARVGRRVGQPPFEQRVALAQEAQERIESGGPERCRPRWQRSWRARRARLARGRLVPGRREPHVLHVVAGRAVWRRQRVDPAHAGRGQRPALCRLPRKLRAVLDLCAPARPPCRAPGRGAARRAAPKQPRLSAVLAPAAQSL